MADDLKQTGKPDDSRLNVDQEHEFGYWSAKFGGGGKASQRTVSEGVGGN
jgi:hypothetical protein